MVGARPRNRAARRACQAGFSDTPIAYLRWYWSAEPQHGQYRWDLIEMALAEAQKHGQRLTIRLMPWPNIDPLPEWYRTSSTRRANKTTDKEGAIRQPDFSDPPYLKYWGELVAAAGRRYDGNPILDKGDILGGLLGRRLATIRCRKQFRLAGRSPE